VSTAPPAPGRTAAPAGEYGALAAAGSRVLLVGTGRHGAQSDLPDLPSVASTVAAMCDVLTERCGVRPESIGAPLLDPAAPAEIGQAVVSYARAATDVLLVYYCGHGLIGPDAQLYLATSQTVRTGPSLGFTALPYQQLQQALADCPAQNIVVILDCCFAGRAGSPAPGALAALAAPGAAAGGYLLAAAAYGESALAPPGEAHTAFSGAAISLLSDGIPDGPRLLTLGGIYRALDRTLSAQGRPRPYSRSSGSAGDLVLAANPRYQPPLLGGALLPAEPPGDTGAPYRGLAAYGEADAPYFFGREHLLIALRGALASQLGEAGPLVVLGPSGAGKSSLLRAGLRPSLDTGLPGAPEVKSWPKIVFTPANDPLGSLAGQLGALLAADPGSLRDRLGHPAGLTALAREAVDRHAGGAATGNRQLILIADQFEEIFGPETSRADRAAFLAALAAATSRPAGGGPPAVLLIAGLRADFYGRALSVPFLAGALTRKRSFDVTPMSRDEIREVITGPAAAAGLAVEPELTGRILADLHAEDAGGGTSYDTRLPLLSHALLQTWRYRQGSTLTLRGYQAAGGVGGAIAQSARALWPADDGRAAGQAAGHGQLPGRTLTSEAERDVARRLLLELVYVGPEGTAAVRRRVPLTELAEALGAGPADLDRTRLVSQVLGMLVGARLVTVGQDYAEIVHDALLGTWPQLQEWIDADRANLVAGREAAEAAAEWNRHGRRRGDLYAGSRLVAARQWAAASRHVPRLVAEFLRRSERAARARRRRTAGVITALVAALALIATLLALSLTELGNVRAKTAALESGEVAASAGTVAGSDPELARELALAAYRLSPTAAAAQALANASVTPSAAELDAGGHALSVAFSPDGALLAASSTAHGGTVSLWAHPESGRPVRAGTLPISHPCVLAFLPRTEILAADCHGATTLWNVSRPSRPVQLAHFGAPGQAADALAVSPDGRWLATGGTHGLFQLWDIADLSGIRLAGSLSLRTAVSSLTSVGFSANSGLLALGTIKGASVASLHGPAPLAHLVTLRGSQNTAAVAFSPRGALLAIGGAVGVTFWDVARPGQPTKIRPTSEFGAVDNAVQSIAFAPDAGTIALGQFSGGITMATLTPAAQMATSLPDTLPSSAATESTAYSPDGSYVAGAGADGIVRVWNVTRYPAGPLLSEPGTQRIVSPDGKLLALPIGNPGGPSEGPEVWDISDPARPVRAAILPAKWARASFIGHARILMATNAAGTQLQLWNLADPRAPAAVGQLFTSHGGRGSLVASASPDGALLAVGDAAAATITVWDIRRPADPVRWATIVSPALAHTRFQSFFPSFLSNTVLDVVSPQGNRLLRWDVSRRGVASPLSPLVDPGGHQLSSAVSCRSTLVTAAAGNPVLLWAVRGPRTVVRAGQLDTPSSPLGAGPVVNGNGNCLLAEATNAGTTDDVQVWAAASPGHPRHVATMQTTGTVAATAVSDDGTRVAALIESPPSSDNETLDVWSVSSSGATSQLAALPVSGGMGFIEFIPHSHLIVFNPPTVNEILPDILDPDPAVTYRALCASAQDLLSRRAWQQNVPTGIPYEPPC
jgi:WD40 repeat protein